MISETQYQSALRKVIQYHVENRPIERKPVSEQEGSYEDRQKRFLDTAFYDLDLSVRLYNALKRNFAAGAGPVTVRDMLNNGLNLENFTQCKNAGKRTVEELDKLFGSYGVCFATLEPICESELEESY